MELLIAAISLGLLGSFHCIGMCGPIALALPVHQYSPFKKYLGILLYNLGRVSTYTFLGVIFGLLGQSFFIGGFQQIVSISIGVLLLLSVILTKTKWFNTPSFGFLYAFINKVKLQLGNLFSKKGLHFLFFIGLLNGLLPCGLVYLGIAGAMATGNYFKGAEFMFYFGIGTVPIMFAVAFLGQFITVKFRNNIRHAMPYVVSFMAVLLIVRGLNLGIPYVSPEFEKNSNTVSCCEKKEMNAQKEFKRVKSCCHKK
ncbi:MAG: sulfite exporter TauE/SafE family protein [Bacteroidota bacterium]|nr:sulfite exporter TauE/SafE family protein [Bacteroidota bacterium]